MLDHPTDSAVQTRDFEASTASVDLPDVPPTAHPRLEWLIRALAYGIDQALLLGIIFLVARGTGRAGGMMLRANGLTFEVDRVVKWPFFVAGFVSMTAYFVFFEWLCAATPGKFILRRRVVRDDGSACPPSSALVRALLRTVDGLLFGVIAYVNMKNSPRCQRLGDTLARTVVVRSHAVSAEAKRRPRPIAAVSLFVLSGVVVEAVSLWAAVPILRADEAYRQRPVGELNVAATELGPEFVLREDRRVPIASEKIREANERFFVAPAVAIASRVVVFNTFLTDDVSSLNRLVEAWARAEVSAARDFQPAGMLICSDRSTVRQFTTGTDDQESYAAAFVKRNVLAFVISLGPRERNPRATLQDSLCTVAHRVR